MNEHDDIKSILDIYQSILSNGENILSRELYDALYHYYSEKDCPPKGILKYIDTFREDIIAIILEFYVPEGDEDNTTDDFADLWSIYQQGEYMDIDDMIQLYEMRVDDPEGGRMQERDDFIEYALAFFPGDQYLLYHKCCILCDMGTYKKAEKVLIQLEAIDTTDIDNDTRAKIYRLGAEIYAALREGDRAKQYLAYAKRLDNEEGGDGDGYMPKA